MEQTFTVGRVGDDVAVYGGPNAKAESDEATKEDTDRATAIGFMDKCEFEFSGIGVWCGKHGSCSKSKKKRSEKASHLGVCGWFAGDRELADKESSKSSR